MCEVREKRLEKALKEYTELFVKLEKAIFIATYGKAYTFVSGLDLIFTAEELVDKAINIIESQSQRIKDLEATLR